MTQPPAIPANHYPRRWGPGRVLGWLAGIAIVGAALMPSPWFPRMLFAMLVAGWLVTLMATCFVPVPRPVAELSAFAARSTWMLKAALSILMLGVTATYGGFVGAAVQSYEERGEVLTLDATNELIFTPLAAVSSALPVVFGMWLCGDLVRAGTGGRRCAAEGSVHAASTALAWAIGTFDARPPLAIDRSDALKSWCADGIEELLRPGWVLLFGYLGPVLVYIVAYNLVNPGARIPW